MPTIERDGAVLQYEARGTGPAVLLHHALVTDRRSWDMIGVPDRLVAAGFCCVTFDALGHGRSGAATAGRAGLEARVADVAAIADTVSADRFHYVGYSMGAWVGTGLARHMPHRLHSMFLAGWDPIDGARRFTCLTDTASRNDEFAGVIRSMMAEARREPDPARVKGYLATYERLFVDLPSITYLIGLDFPVSMAVGDRDAYCGPVQDACEALAVECLILPGDHMTAFIDPAYCEAIADWCRRVAR
jgi:pimeloyl-ACP methyl ester carboxylesterase